ncbi:MAG: NADH-quinone oxidoreductase subunit NuoE [Desulfobacteraceae bacterium]|nr:MAG: NADH-quinone oxidoreductase subunit NuoE [Desulfobacteraceae bacterium]
MIEQAVELIQTKYSKAKRDSLIPLLQDIQTLYGYLPKEVILEVNKRLGIPTSKIYGVASFYNQFRFQQIGKYHIQLCRGTACHVKGSKRLLDKVQKLLKIEPGQTTRDALFSLEIVACLGGCGLSPVIAVNGEFYARMTPKKTEELINSLRSGHEK